MGALASVTGAAQPKQINFQTLMSTAEKHNLALALADNDSNRAQARLRGSRAELLPSLAIETSGTWQDPALPDWSSGAYLTIKQKLFDGGSSWINLRRAQLTRNQSHLSHRAARDTLVFNLLVAYIECHKAQTRLRVAKRKVELFEAQIDLVRRQFQQGLKKQTDFRLLEAEMERAKLAVDRSAVNTFERYRELENIVGAESGWIDEHNLKFLKTEQILNNPIWKPSALTFDARKDSFEVQAQTLEVLEKELAVSQTKLAYWPVLNLTAAASYGAPNVVGRGSAGWNERRAWNSNVGINLNWTLWNWGGNSANVALANADFRQANKALEQSILVSQNRFLAIKQKLDSSTRMLDLQKRIRTLELTSVQETQSGYREGRLKYLDLTSGIEREIESEINFENEAFDYLLTAAELMKLKGTLYENAKNF